ncbi:MAG TPA: hypothetical protein VLH75_12185 [Longimicrobiales bacterium]|nr:hypothetical protein [Longimicrobiales bacterium]
MSMSTFRTTAILALVLAGAALPSSARAQLAASPGSPAAAAAAATNPALLGPQVAPVDFVRWAPPSPLDEAAPQDRVRAGPNIAMMAVGGAAMVVGLIIGGDGGLVIATGGGLVALVGLWRYLR